MKSKGMAYLLWLICGFGWLGLHRFYLDKVAWASFGCSSAYSEAWVLVDLFTLGGNVEYNINEELKTLRRMAARDLAVKKWYSNLSLFVPVESIAKNS